MIGRVWSRRHVLSACGSITAIPCLAIPETAYAATSIRLEDFGGGIVPGLDNVDPMRRALAAAARGSSPRVVRLGPGTYEFSSLQLLRGGAIRRPSGVTITGAGIDRTTAKVTGRSIINHLFDASGSSHVVTRDLALVGNGVKDEAAPYAGGLMVAIQGHDAAAAMRNIVFERCEIRNFASAAWFSIQNLSPDHEISHVGSKGCRWVSTPNTAPQAGSLLVPGHFVYFNASQGSISDVSIDDPLMDATHLKGGVGLVGDLSKAAISVKSLVGAGAAIEDISATGDGGGSYAVLLYANKRAAPRQISIAIRRLIDARSVGIYSVGAHAVSIRIGEATGQRDTRDATLFKGVVACMGGRDIMIVIGKVQDCARVVMLSLDGGNDVGEAAENTNMTVQVGQIMSREKARDITIDAGNSPWTGGVRISGTRSGPADVGVDLRAGPKTGLQDVDLSRFVNNGAETPLVLPERRGGRSRRLRLAP